MVIFSRIIAGVRAPDSEERVEQELDDELREYLNTAVEQKMSSGMSREAAIRAARVEMGSLERGEGRRARRRVGVRARDASGATSATRFGCCAALPASPQWPS